MGNMSVR
jgi:hypothetical protein